MPPKRYFDEEESTSKEEGSSAAPQAEVPIKTGTSPRGQMKPNSTLFVSRLPYTATTTDVQTLFSEIGPLKRAFVVTDPITKKSKGVGYVTFAIPEDAKTALEQLQNKSLDGGKRKIQITFADHKDPAKRTNELNAPPSAKRPKVESSNDAVPTSRQKPAILQEKDADAVRTVILSGLAGCTPMPDSKQIYKRARKIGDVENVIYPHPTSSRPEDVAHVIYRTPNHAMTAVEKLHAHVFKGVQISAILKKRADNAAKIAAHMRPETLEKREKMRQEIEKQSGKGTMPVLLSEIDKSSRLIVRNLPFDVTEADLRSIFLPFGPVYQITVPKAKSKTSASGDADAIAAKEEDEEMKIESTDDAGDENEGKEAEEADDDEDKDEDEADDDDDDDNSDDSDAVEDDASVEKEVEKEIVDAAAEPSAMETQASTEAETLEVIKAGEVDNSDTGSEEDEDEDDNEVDEEEDEGKTEVKQEESSELPSESSTTSKAPTAASRQPAEKGRGFAFVWMVSRNDAAKAMAAINGKSIQHGAAERAAYKAAKGSKGRRFAKAALDRVRAHAQPAREVAVDWSLSKKDWEAKADQSEAEDDSDEGQHNDDADSDDEKPERPKLPEPEEGTTLFIRNLPYQATEDELRSLFRQFGPLRYAKITMDRATNRSKGTGFVCFWQPSSAEAALAQARIIERESGVGSSSSSSAGANVKNPFSMPSVLTADPAAPLTASLNLHGRVLNVIPAVARDEASRLETSGRKVREAGDKRNTWLLREGVPFPNSDFADRLPPSEVEKRLQSFQVRKAQMGANPSLFVSKTRLSIRSLPLFVSDRMLKRLAIHAIKAFNAEVKAGTRADLDADEKADRTISSSVENRKRKPGERPTSVVQSKVVRTNDRVEALTGQGKSKGYGFLEMKSFNEALKVIRWANGNKAIAKLFGEWWQDDLQQQIDRVATQIQAKQKSLEGKKEDPDTIKAEIEELDVRKKRLRMKLNDLKESGSGGGDKAERGGSLMIEFAIENVVTTKKRADKLKAIKESAVRRKEKEERAEEVEKTNLEQQRLEAQAARKIEAEKNKPKGHAHGHVIGKKRKERKARRG